MSSLVSSPPIRILCVEDHAVVREGLTLIIEHEPDMRVVGSATSAEEGVDMFLQIRPDITLMDLELGAMSGLDAIEAIIAQRADARIIVLTMHHDSESIHRALAAGATTYLLKDTLSRDLIRVIREVHAGGRPLSREVAERLAERATQPTLTSREIQIVALMSDGLSNKQIAQQLRISDQTVHAHLRNIFTKLDVSDRTAAVAAAVRRGLVRIR